MTSSRFKCAASVGVIIVLIIALILGLVVGLKVFDNSTVSKISLNPNYDWLCIGSGAIILLVQYGYAQRHFK